MKTIVALVLLLGVGGWLLWGGGDTFLQEKSGGKVTLSSAASSSKSMFGSLRSFLGSFFNKSETATTTSVAPTQKTTSPKATSTTPTPPITTLGVTKVLVGGVEVVVEVADTEASREQGLSGRATLPEGRGMLFVFDKPDRYGFWMKDMKFPIDIIWIDSAFRIILIKESVSPSTYPTLFRPTDPALYVLEVPSGFSAKYGLSVGNKIRVIEE